MAFLNLESSGDAPWNLGSGPWAILRRGFRTILLERFFARRVDMAWQAGSRRMWEQKLNVAINCGICICVHICRRTSEYAMNLGMNVWAWQHAYVRVRAFSSLSDSREAKNPGRRGKWCLLLVYMCPLPLSAGCNLQIMSHSPWGKEEKWRYQHISSGCVRLLANIFFLRNRRSSAGASTENFIKKQPKRVRRAKQAHTKINKEGDGEGERGDSRNKGGDKENYKLHQAERFLGSFQHNWTSPQ